jgi:spore coat protein U-like protein
MIKKLVSLIPAVAMTGALVAGSMQLPAMAGSSTSTMLVSALVVNSCTIVAAPMVFPNYNPNGAEATTTAAITTLCTPGASATLSMNTGNNAGGPTAFTARAMNNGSSLLNYQVYTDSGHTHIWGDGTNGTSTVPVSGGLLNVITTAYGTIPTGQNATALLYGDSVVVTVSF